MTATDSTDTSLLWREYVLAVRFHMKQHPDWRKGQTLFNCLFFANCGGFDPQWAEEIKGGPLDPFYQDSRIPAFIAALKRHWS